MTGIAEPLLSPSPAAPPASATAQPLDTEPWSLATRVAFRFCVLYFGLYILMTQMLGGVLPIPGFGFPPLLTLQPMRSLVFMVGNGLLGVKPTLHPTGSGDTLYDYTFAVTALLIAAIGTAIWSAAARHTTSHPRLFKWFRLFVRVGLGTTMLLYGFIKVFPLQMGHPTFQLTRLLEPYGDFSPMGVIWSSIGSSPGYQRFIGSAEVVAGVLLLVPWTSLVGALVSFGVATGVFMVNMTYDVPVKLFSLHLVLMAIFLIVPDTRRLVDWFVLNRPVPPRPNPRYGSSDRAHRAWIIAQLMFLTWAVGNQVYRNAQSWKSYGGGAAKSPLYGIWDVDSMSINGELRPPLTTDTLRYSHAVFTTTNAGMVFQKMDQKFQRYTGRVDSVNHKITLGRASDSTWKSELTYERPLLSARLIFEGKLDGNTVRIAMTKHDLSKFFLRSRGFNWVQEYPINR